MDKKLRSGGLYKALSDLLAWFDECAPKSIIIGGVAVSLLSRPRNTQDIDAMVFLEPEKWAEFLDSGKKFGYRPRIKNSLRFARENSILLLRHEDSSTDVDISFGALPFEEEAIKRSVKLKIQDISIPLPSPEDLIIMKAVAHRPIDMEDIRNILALNMKIDEKRVKYWVKEFAAVLEMPEILEDLQKLLNERSA